MQQLPLSHLKVIDLTIARSGPVAVRQLADWGADVIQVQSPIVEQRRGQLTESEGGDYQNLHRNKRSLNLDLKAAAGRDILRKLVEGADIVVENFRPRVKHRLEVDYETLAAVNPRLIYASISAFGQDGPYRDRPGLDQVVQGMSGLMSVTGLPGQGPVRAGFAPADVLAGLYLAQAILIAVIERASSGRGQWVQTSLLESLLAAMDFQVARVLVEGETPLPTGNNHPTVALMGLFPALDGVVNIGAVGAAMFEATCKAVGAETLLTKPAYASERDRQANRDALNAELAQHTSKLSRADLVSRLNTHGVPCGPVNDIAEALADPQVQHQNLCWPYVHRRLGPRALVGQPFQLTRTPHRGVRRAPPQAGADSREILRDLGLREAEIDELEADRII